MSSEQEPNFLTREQVDTLHELELKNHGGQPGTRSEHSLESAIAQPQHVYYYSQGDHFDVAAAYAFHIAENQPYIDGNKRAGVAAALVYLDSNGIETENLSESKTHQLMIDVANKSATRDDIAQHFRSTLSQEQDRQQQSTSTPLELATPAQPTNPYQLSPPVTQPKQNQPKNPYQLPGIDDDTGHHH